MAHEHIVVDTDNHFTIDKTTREISTKSGNAIIMQHDHNSERFTFDMPRMIDGHDMTLCNQVQVHFINIGATAAEINEDVYDVEDFAVSEENDEIATLSWLISGNATQYAGSLHFLIKFKCIVDGKVEYAWNTAIYKAITVSNGMDNGEAVAYEYSDILAAWEARLDVLEQGGVSGAVLAVNGVTPDENGNVTIDFTETVNEALAQAKESGEFDGVDGITPHIGDNGNWFIGDTDTGKPSRGESGAMAPKINNNVKTVNHRGFSGVAPENTIPAYILSKQNGYEYVECDVAFTSDGVAVLLHDATIDRTSNGSGAITEMTYAEASQYDYGSWKDPKFEGTHLPTFREFIILCKNLGLHPYIELKSDGGYTQENITSIVDEVKACGMDGKVTYISFNSTYLGYVKNVDGNARLGYVMSTVTTAKLDEAVALRTDTNDVFIDAKYSSLTASNVNACISRGLPLEVWTVDDPSWFNVMNPYISGVTTNTLNAGDILYEKSIIYTPPSGVNITLPQPQLEMTSFDSQTLKATLEPANASVAVEWSSSNADVAAVKDGVITPNSSGVTIITATAGSVSASCIVTVNVEDLTVPEGYEAVRLLKFTDIMYNVGTSWKPADCENNPPYTMVQAYRAGYYLTDIPVEYGYAYRIDFISSNSGTMVGQQIANTKMMEYINNPSADITNETLKKNLADSGWLENGVDYVIPEEVNGYPLETMRITFKQGSSVYKGTEIRQVLISRKAV